MGKPLRCWGNLFYAFLLLFVWSGRKKFNLVPGVHSPREQRTLGMFVTTLHRSKQTVLTDGCSSKIYWMLCSWSNRSDKYYPKLQILQILVTWTALSLILQRDTTVFVGYAKEGHNERDILLATSWKTSCVLDGCTHTRGGKLEEWDWIVTTIWEQCCSYWYLKMIWRNSLFQISKLPCCNQLWKVWPFCCCRSAKFLTPTALLLKTIRLERIDSSRDHFFTRLRTTWQKHILQRPGCASWDSSFVFPVLEGFWGGFKEKPVRLTNI